MGNHQRETTLSLEYSTLAIEHTMRWNGVSIKNTDESLKKYSTNSSMMHYFVGLPALCVCAAWKKSRRRPFHPA